MFVEVAAEKLVRGAFLATPILNGVKKDKDLHRNFSKIFSTFCYSKKKKKNVKNGLLILQSIQNSYKDLYLSNHKTEKYL